MFGSFYRGKIEEGYCKNTVEYEFFYQTTLDFIQRDIKKVLLTIFIVNTDVSIFYIYI
jgi:hypothetical protein